MSVGAPRGTSPPLDVCCDIKRWRRLRSPDASVSGACDRWYLQFGLSSGGILSTTGIGRCRSIPRDQKDRRQGRWPSSMEVDGMCVSPLRTSWTRGRFRHGGQQHRPPTRYRHQMGSPDAMPSAQFDDLRYLLGRSWEHHSVWSNWKMPALVSAVMAEYVFGSCYRVCKDALHLDECGFGYSIYRRSVSVTGVRQFARANGSSWLSPAPALSTNRHFRESRSDRCP